MAMEIDEREPTCNTNLASMDNLEASKWNLDRLVKVLEPDSSDDEDVRQGKTNAAAEQPSIKRQKSPRLIPRPPPNAPSAPSSSRPRRYRTPRPPSRFVSVDRYDYERYLKWCTGQRSKGWTVEEQFLAQHRTWQPNPEYLSEMGDGDHRRHGGHGNRAFGGGGRKRKYYGGDDDDFDRARPRRDYHPKPPLEVRVREQIYSIADATNRNCEEDCAELADIISTNEQDSHFLDEVLNAIPQLTVEQPMKIPHAAAIILHLNDKKPEVAAKFLAATRTRAQEAIDGGEWRTVKLLLRFLACLHSIFEGANIITLLDELFARASDLQMASSEDAFGIELVKIIQLTIPYALASGAQGLEQPVADLLEKTEIIASAPAEGTLSVSPFMSTDNETAPELPSVISILQAQLQAEQQEGYPLNIIPRIYRKSAPKSSDDNVMDSETTKHEFPALTVPEKLNPGRRSWFPEVHFSLYAEQELETVPPTPDLAASIVRDVCVDTINILDYNRDKAVRYLIDLKNYFPADAFAPLNLGFDRIRELDADQSTWKPEDILMDAIFSQLLTLPAPEHKLVYYHSCVTVACREAASAIAPSLGRAIRFLYSNLPTLDLELGYRFMDWFSHHLSNYDYRWKWQEWADDVELSALDPRNAFIRGVLDKEIRLSFARRIRDSLPDAYDPLVPASKDNDIPPFKYGDGSTSFSSEAQAILTALKGKQADTEIAPTLAAITEQASEYPIPALPAIDAYVTALCFIGSKSLSHVLSFIERCKVRLFAFSREAPDEASALAARIQIVESVVEYWRETQAGVAVNLVDKLTNYSMITPAAVVAWALGAGTALPDDLPRADPHSLCESWMFEMVAATLTKVSSRVRQIVAMRLSAGLTPDQVTQVDDTLAREAADMSALFASVEAALATVASGSAAGMTDGNDDGQSAQLLRWWGTRWLRVFERKRRVEERVLVEARQRFPEPADLPPADIAVEDAAAEDGNVSAGNDADIV